MSLAPVPHRTYSPASATSTGNQNDSLDWIAIAAGGSLIAAGLLMLAGKRRAAMAAAAAGTSLAMLEQQELLRTLWRQLPGYVDQVQSAINQVRSTVEEISAQTGLGSDASAKPSAR